MSEVNKSLLAKLLATENITVQHTPGIKTAMFDLKNRVLMMPIWHNISNDLQDLLLVHETGHALDTPTFEYKKAIETIAENVFPNEKVSEQLKGTVRGFLNVIEDARIDKRQKRRYPGSRKNYLIGYKELMERDFFGTAKKDVNSMNLIDRLNIYFKGGNITQKILFTPEENVFLRKVESLETFSEAVAVTEEIYRFCKDELEKEQSSENDLLEGEEDEEEGEGDDADDFDDNGYGDDTDSESGDSEEGDEENSGEGSGESSSQEPSDALTGEGDIGATSDGAGGDTPASSNAPRSETDETWEQKIQEIVKDENQNYVYLSLPDINYDKAIHDYKQVLNDWRTKEIGQTTRYGTTFSQEMFNGFRKELIEWKVKEKDTISFLVKEFEQRKAAEMYSRINIAKTGVIDTNKLYTYKYNDDIFRRLASQPKGKNHGFVMFLDWSGSMTWNLRHTMKQLFSLVLFCKQIQVPFEVYAFKDEGENPFTYINKVNVIKGETVVLRNFLSSRMNTNDLNDAMTFLWAAANRQYLVSDGMSGTPLNEALMIAPKIINDFRAKNKLEIVNTIILTDGESNPLAGIVNKNQTYGNYRDNYFYNDPQTGKTYNLKPYGYADTRANTAELIRRMKDLTDSNVIGFFLADMSFNKLSRIFDISRYGNQEYWNNARKFWNDNKFYPLKSQGYDEYYIINVDAMKDTVNNLEIDTKKSAKHMAKAFSKFAQKKTVNRILLRQFIEKVAGQSKKVA